MYDTGYLVYESEGLTLGDETCTPLVHQQELILASLIHCQWFPIIHHPPNHGRMKLRWESRDLVIRRVTRFGNDESSLSDNGDSLFEEAQFGCGAWDGARGEMSESVVSFIDDQWLVVG